MGKWTYCTRSGIIRCDDKPIEGEDVLRILNAHEQTWEALRDYGDHKSMCNFYSPTGRNAATCNCGYSAALAAAAGGSDE